MNPDDLLPLLLTGAFGVFVGVALMAGLARLRQRRAAPQPMPDPVPAPVQPTLTGHGASAAAATAATPARPPRQRTPAATLPLATVPPAALPKAADLLLVDDSAVARTKLRRLFEAAGYTVHLACDGVEALSLLKQGRYAMMITDLEMPNMDGVTLINTCVNQAHSAGMPIMAISGHEGLRAKFNECREVCGIHRKPWVDDILLSHVAAVVTPRREHVPCLID